MNLDRSITRGLPRISSPDACSAHDWRAGLPPSWLTQVVRPVFFSRQREYEIQAERVTGFETESEPCYCRYDAVLTELRSDDDEHWYVQPVYAEQLTGWRLIDGRWLIRRQISNGERCDASRSFFTLSEDMPR
jgi:hypothetical protein